MALRRPAQTTKPEEKPQIPACEYAGDAGDEYCKSCNGVTMMVDGIEVSCKTCGGYLEPAPAPAEEDAPPVEQPAPEKPSQDLDFTGTNCSVCGMPQFNSPSGITCPKGHGSSPAAEEMPKADVKNPAATTQKPAAHTEALPPVQSEEVKEHLPLGVTTTIKAESGVSFEVKDKSGLSRWYKLAYSEERIVPADCDIDVEKEALWNDVNETVDKQIEDTLIYVSGK